MASHWSDTEPGDTRRLPSNARVVIVDHAPMDTSAAIVDVVTSCGVAPRQVPPGSQIDSRAGECAIALVRVAGPPSSQAAVLDEVRRLKAGGYTVLCCATASSRWPLGVRCRLLLCGASDVFDSGAPGFARELRARLDA